METLFIYLIKSNALIAVFFLAYYFLVQKETFFNSNRWFLLSGLFTSVTIPLFFIKKIVFIESPKMAINPIQLTASTTEIIPEESFDWFPVLAIGYLIIGCVLLLKIVSNLISLFKLLNKKQIIKNENFNLVDVNENITPFSFFKYIVFNSSFYSNDELESILLHEKVHSREKHSIDVLIAKLFCSVFWFNPFVWLYKKAILQNLEYIADQKAIQNIENKKAYQMTLLKVVTDQNCLSITNSFYQSLIKKRIVMLNKNQSKKWNTWKYAVVVPVLVAFVLFFQIKVVAQERENSREQSNQRVTEMIWTKDTPDEELNRDVKFMQKQGVTIKYSKLKRNAKGEITSIRVEFKDNEGNKGVTQVNSDKPIQTIQFYKTDNTVGFRNSSGARNNNRSQTININEEEDSNTEYSYNYNNEDKVEMADMPTPPAAPTPPTPPKHDMSNMPKPPTPPNFPSVPNVKAPKDPNDKKAWEKYEAEMENFAKEWENGSEMKKFEAEMKAYEKKMEAYEPDMSAFEKEMEKFEARMEKYNDEMESYHEKIREANENRQEALRDQMEAKRDAEREIAFAKRDAERDALVDKKNAEREALFAKRDAQIAKRDAMLAKREAERARQEAENAKKNDVE
jgi:hypothetical protein